MGEVYCLTFPNGKKYVGLTQSTSDDRLKRHLKDSAYSSRMAVHAAMKLIAPEDIKLEVLLKSDVKEELIAAEMFFIEKLNTRPPHGYNLTGGGDGCRELDPDVEIRRKQAISKSLTGKKLTAEHRLNLSLAHMGKRSRPDGWNPSVLTRQRMSEAAKRRYARNRENANAN